jgi:hypothetical protein
VRGERRWLEWGIFNSSVRRRARDSSRRLKCGFVRDDAFEIRDDVFYIDVPVAVAGRMRFLLQ